MGCGAGGASFELSKGVGELPSTHGTALAVYTLCFRQAFRWSAPPERKTVDITETQSMS